MAGQGRPPRIFLAAAWLALFFVTAHAAAEPPRSLPAMLEDAELRDVCFADPDHGWVVGDRGVIWHTGDGGRHWRLQTAPTTCRLESVSFLDDRNGWAVGGWIAPHLHLASGVVLRTFDGGQRWEAIPRLSLPGLKRVKFLDARNGWALGNSSALYPAGLFRTNDGGRSWESVIGSSGPGWLTGDFESMTAGVVGGESGLLAPVDGRGLRAVEGKTPASQHLRALRLVNAGPRAGSLKVPHSAQALQPGWAVGDRGTVLVTTDGGRHWQPPLAEVDPAFDFHALAVMGEHVWIAGDPGTRVFHSPDAGRTWQAAETGTTLPIRAMTFLDQNRGWAVGSLGTVLATRDGGRTWQTQRQGGSRAALLGIFATAERIPLELFAEQAAGEGFIAAVEVLQRGETAERQATAADERLHGAVVAAGASHATLMNDQISPEVQEELLVQTIRQWRPEVIVTEAASPQGDDPLGHGVNQTVLAAVEKAADELAYEEQQTRLGLGPWQVKKVYGFLGGDAAGGWNITTAQLSPRLGQSLADHVRPARQLLFAESPPAPQTLGFRLIVNHTSDSASGRGCFTGINLQPGGPARRRIDAAAGSQTGGDARELIRKAQQRRNAEMLFEHLAKNANSANWLSQIDSLTRELDANSSAETLDELAAHCTRAGRLEPAAAIREHLVRRFPHHPLTPAAALWLVRYFGSSEVAAWQEQRPEQSRPDASREEKSPVRTAGFEAPVAAVGTQAGAVTGLPDGLIQRTSAEQSSRDPSQRAERAAAFADAVKHAWPLAYAEAELRFPLAATQRQAADNVTAAAAEPYWNWFTASQPQGDWWWCAKAESWLQRPTPGQPPKPLAHVASAAAKPRLDGVLDETFWQNAAPIVLTEGGRKAEDLEFSPAKVRLARDAEFFYLAVEVQKARGGDYPADTRPRSHDADLSARDRVTLRLDRDRDYASFFELTVDHRGWTNDSCFAAANWNPQWFVAARDDGESWTVEAAIAWSELGGSPARDAVWVLGLRRTVPEVGEQHWPETADSSSGLGPADLGLLRFDSPLVSPAIPAAR